jgi:[protein-PII] uridylyltransferase
LNPSEADRLKSNLIDVLNGKLELARLMSGRIEPGSRRRPKVTVPAQVRFDDTASSHSTLLELVMHDRPGLLYEVASVLAEAGCDIKIALIDTEGEKVIDVFYVTSAGRKLMPGMQEAVRKALVSRLRLPVRPSPSSPSKTT